MNKQIRIHGLTSTKRSGTKGIAHHGRLPEFIALSNCMSAIEQSRSPKYWTMSAYFLAMLVFPDFKEASMSGTGTAKSKQGNVDADSKKLEVKQRTMGPTEERNLDQGLEAEEQKQEDERSTVERNEQQDLNQGMATGTHDSTRHGVNWGAAYRTGTAVTKKRVKNEGSSKKSG